MASAWADCATACPKARNLRANCAFNGSLKLNCIEVDWKIEESRIAAGNPEKPQLIRKHHPHRTMPLLHAIFRAHYIPAQHHRLPLLDPGASMVTSNSDCSRGKCSSEINAPCNAKSRTSVSSSNGFPPSVTPLTRARNCASRRSAVRVRANAPARDPPATPA